MRLVYPALKESFYSNALGNCHSLELFFFGHKKNGFAGLTGFLLVNACFGIAKGLMSHFFLMLAFAKIGDRKSVV